MVEWKKTACILCECNCGLEVQLGGQADRHLVKLRGDKAHPSSQGYACEKPHRLDHYQHGTDRLTSPLRRRADGTFEEIDWETAIREVAQKLAAVRDTHDASADELAAGARGLPDDTALMASEVVVFTAEVRCWVLEGEVLTLACYEGEADEPALEAARKLAAEAAGDAAVPSPCVLDLGFVAGRGWVVIEANAAWGAGLNGCDPAAAARCVARASRTAAPS
ncbi:MAG: ATP-grasp domain-containing protein [Kofleriaceae bacterium]|nr:ATP-grasp domain-containing protein [Kofleriaceae bacterium]